MSFKSFLAESDPDYKGDHQAPYKDGSSRPMHDLTGIYPDDFYSSNGFRYYADTGSSYDRESYDLVVRAKYHPGKQIRVYRAIPKSATARINERDWVTINRAYAKDHGESALNGDYRIISKLVSARDLWTDGNSIHEWGYDPQPYDGPEERRYKEKRTSRP